ncbi:MAG: hypothetical protein ACQGVC_05985 [Myxococcota bacterium]
METRTRALGIDRNGALRLLAAVVAGALVSRLVLDGGSVLLRAVWPAYAAAEPDRAYSLAMLLTRLVLFAGMIAAVSAAGTWVARDRRFRWVAGGIILAISAPPHLLPGEVWDAYPVWYHLTYLASILPVAVWAGGRAARYAPEPSVATEPG